MLTYEETMRHGAAEYAVAALRAAGFPARFTQTGGMNAAIESVLDGGGRLLVTDRDDSLAWSRAEHRGWAVGVYPPGESVDPLAFDGTADGGCDGLAGAGRSGVPGGPAQVRPHRAVAVRPSRSSTW